MKVKYPGRLIHIIGGFLGGIWFFNTLINIAWQEEIKQDNESIRVKVGRT